MTRLPHVAAALAAALSVAGLTPAPAHAGDDRLHTVTYDADTVVRVHGRRGFQSMIEFAPGERIENVAVGDSAAWQVTPNKRANILFLKPVLPDARSNMTVVTDRRTYLFDLVTAPAKALPVYALRFAYPPEPQPAAPEPVQRAAAPTAPPLAHHYGWAVRGDASLAPARAYDDGVTTYLSWPAKAELPAILTPAADGAESPVNYAVKGEVIEIDQVHPVLVLRSGERRATLTRTPPAAVPARRAEAVSPVPTEVAER